MKKPRIVFFGTPEIAVIVLKEMLVAGYKPFLVVTNPDSKQGRGNILTAPPVKLLAEKKQIPVIQPTNLKEQADTELEPLLENDWDLSVVAAYGKILPAWLVERPSHGTLNVHPSLLPRFRGASPIRSAILADERETGVSIMLIGSGIDDGPVVAQEKALIAKEKWPLSGLQLDRQLAELGGKLLVKTIPKWLSGRLKAKPQDETAATYSVKITRPMGELALDPLNLPTGQEAYEMLLKIRAFTGWPETFFKYRDRRIKIKEAELTGDTLTPTRVIPEGKKEISFTDFRNSLNSKKDNDQW